MQWLQTLDVQAFRFLNQGLANPFLDRAMPFASGNPFFYPALLVCAIVLVWKGRTRGVLCLVMVVLAVSLADGFICNTLKHVLGRERPFLALPGVHLPPSIGRGGSGSMPSAHATNWFAATMVTMLYYRRSLWFMLPLALTVGFSRIYNGVHYPSDVLAGAVLGAGCGAATVLLLNTLWVWAGRKWFPLWWNRMPSLLAPPQPEATEQGDDEAEFCEASVASSPASQVTAHASPAAGLPRSSFHQSNSAVAYADAAAPLPATRGIAPAGFRAPHTTLDEHWLRVGYVCIALLLVARWFYIASGTIQLVEDEAYQWLWSKHLALSYYSKPPLIAYTQFLGTSLWGDAAFGVRFFSPLISAILSVLVLRFFGREVNARAGFFLLLILTATPLLAAGSVLMTVDPLSVLFWTAAMLAGWRAIQENATTLDWLWVGLWMGLGFLSKYTALFQWLCWAVLFILWPPARKQLRRPGPYLALAVNVVCALPVLIWNAQHGWITVTHVAERASAGHAWEPTLHYFGEFLGSEAGLLNPVFFAATLWACVAFWRRGRQNRLVVYLFCMGAPLFLAYLLYSFRSRILPNWIAPSVVPLFCLMVVYWDTRARLGMKHVKPMLALGLVLGFALVLIGHNTNLVQNLTGRYLPVDGDPLHRVCEWDTTARVVNEARQVLLAEGKSVFIIADHYGLAGQISFYLPEARANVRKVPLVYCRSSATAENQFYFWPGYSLRQGENAIYVRELSRANPTPLAVPPRLLSEFESVTGMGVSNVWYHGQYLLRPLQLFACRGLR